MISHLATMIPRIIQYENGLISHILVLSHCFILDVFLFSQFINISSIDINAINQEMCIINNVLFIGGFL